jgi:hypothetical protein
LNLVDLATIVLAAGMGFGMARAGLCLLATSADTVVRKDPIGMAIQAFTVGLMGALLLTAARVDASHPHLPGMGGELLPVLLGAVMLALGFAVNGGCYLGSVLYVGQGRANFSLTLVGIYLADRFSVPDRWGIHAMESHVASSPTSLPMSTLFLALGIGAAWLLWSRRSQASTRRVWGVCLAAVSATALFWLHPGWGYGATIAGLAHAGLMSFGLNQIAGLSVFVGAIVSCILAGQWHPSGFTRVGILRCLFGGYIMETGAQCVPGGSDTWVFWTIPGMGTHGLFAYAMVVTLLLGSQWLVAQRVRSVPAAA